MFRAISRLSWPARLAWFAALFAFGVVMFGAFVRLSNAGLSCPDWPTCYGHVTWPHQAHQVARADAAFPQRPVEPGKPWREQFHRMIAGTLGVLVLSLALVAVWRRRWSRWTVIGSAAGRSTGHGPVHRRRARVFLAAGRPGDRRAAGGGRAPDPRAALAYCGHCAGPGDLPGHAGHVDGDVAAGADRGHRAPAGWHGHLRATGLHRAAPDADRGRWRGACAAAPFRGHRHRAPCGSDLPWRLDQHQLRGAGLRRWRKRLPQVHGPMVAGDRLPPGLHPVAPHRRGLRRRHPGRPGAHRHPDGASHRCAGGVSLSGLALAPDRTGRPAGIRRRHRRDPAGAGGAGHQQRALRPAAAGGHGAQRHGRAAVVQPVGDAGADPAAAGVGMRGTRGEGRLSCTPGRRFRIRGWRVQRSLGHASCRTAPEDRPLAPSP